LFHSEVTFGVEDLTQIKLQKLKGKISEAKKEIKGQSATIILGRKVGERGGRNEIDSPHLLLNRCGESDILFDYLFFV